jgi:hypothetical protein
MSYSITYRIAHTFEGGKLAFDSWLPLGSQGDQQKNLPWVWTLKVTSQTHLGLNEKLWRHVT